MRNDTRMAFPPALKPENIERMLTQPDKRRAARVVGDDVEFDVCWPGGLAFGDRRPALLHAALHSDPEFYAGDWRDFWAIPEPILARLPNLDAAQPFAGYWYFLKERRRFSDKFLPTLVVYYPKAISPYGKYRNPDSRCAYPFTPDPAGYCWSFACHIDDGTPVAAMEFICRHCACWNLHEPDAYVGDYLNTYPPARSTFPQERLDTINDIQRIKLEEAIGGGADE